MIKKILLLRQNPYDTQILEIAEEELAICMKDGSIKEGDLIVYPQRIMEATSNLTIKLRTRL